MTVSAAAYRRAGFYRALRRFFFTLRAACPRMQIFPPEAWRHANAGQGYLHAGAAV
jgi:hypothetical protein